MLAAALLAMVPESLDVRWGVELILVGYLVVHFLEHVVGAHYHFAGDEHASENLVSSTVTTAAVFAMFVHTFFDGVAIAGSDLCIYPKLRHEIFNEPERERVYLDILDWLKGLPA